VPGCRIPAVSDSPVPLTGRALGHFRILEQLGAGGMGVVYRARDEQLERDVAVKLLPPGLLADDTARKRFRREALALSKLNHANIATVFAFGNEEGVDYLAMELIPGTTISDKLAGGALPEKEVLQLGAQIVAALEEAHQQGVIHRDLKPGNILVTPRGVAKVLDFGLAQFSRPEGTSAAAVTAGGAATESIAPTRGIVGTPAYMSPEQLRGEPADARTDLYALGCVLYEIATGQPVYREEQQTRLIEAILHRPPVAPRARNERVSPELERIILKCVEKDPERRYQSAKEVGVDLRRLEQPSTGPTVPLPVPAHAFPLRAMLGILALFLAAALGVGMWLYRPGRGAPAIHSLAVLPFVNGNANPDSEYLSDGITTGIIQSLSQLPNTRVLAPGTVFRFKGRGDEPQKIGRDLKVDAVLVGKLTQRGNTLIVQTDLVGVADGSELWGERYDRRLEDLVALQGDIAQEISAKLRFKLTGEEQKKLAKRQTENSEAYQLYLKGRYFSGKATREGFEKGLQYLRQAIDSDTNFARAYEGLSYYYLTASEWIYAPKDAMPRGREAVRKALELDESLAEAHVLLGSYLCGYDWDWAGADKEFRRALELNPNNADAHVQYGVFLVSMGRTEAGLAEARKAMEIDPLSLEVNSFASTAFQFARRFKEATVLSRKVTEMDPNYWFGHFNLGNHLIGEKRFPEAIAEFQKAVALSGGFGDPLAGLGSAYAGAGQRREAMKVLDQMLKLSAKTYIPPYTFAEVYTALGDKEQAFGWLEKSYLDRNLLLSWLLVNPEMDPLRSDPRFADLLRRLRLPPAN
jgi:serine/threonine protein kinase/tetratricopeptide (TPR) repeat protein